jgi:hypothetical protein
VALAVARLKASPAYASEAERVRAFVASGAGCRATYFKHARKLQAATEIPRILLTHTRPPDPPAPTENHFDQLRRRFGDLRNG